MKLRSFFLFGSCLFSAAVCIAALTSFFVKVKDIRPATVLVRTDLKVTTGSIQNVTATTADCFYSIQVIGSEKVTITASGVKVTKRGDKFSKTFPGRLTGGEYKTRMSGLTPGSIYIVKAFATAGGETFYGYDLTFETPAK